MDSTSSCYVIILLNAKGRLMAIMTRKEASEKIKDDGKWGVNGDKNTFINIRDGSSLRCYNDCDYPGCYDVDEIALDASSTGNGQRGYYHGPVKPFQFRTYALVGSSFYIISYIKI